MILFAIKVKRVWHLWSFDVVSAYLHSPIDEEIHANAACGLPMLSHVQCFATPLGVVRHKASCLLLVEVLLKGLI